MDEVELEYRRRRMKDVIYDVFLICPVRGVSSEQRTIIEAYVAKLEGEGKKVYYPARDTDQNNESSLQICSVNTYAIFNSKEVHIFFDPESKGTLFDLGVAAAFGKTLTLVNSEEVKHTDEKSFNNVLLEWIEWQDSIDSNLFM